MRIQNVVKDSVIGAIEALKEDDLMSFNHLLSVSFSWDGSFKGFEYWSGVHSTVNTLVESSEKMSSDFKSELISELMAICQRVENPRPEDLLIYCNRDLECCIHHIENKDYDQAAFNLMRAFDWSAHPAGVVFWDIEYRQMLDGISPSDKAVGYLEEIKNRGKANA